MFRGHSLRSLDPKGRLMLPPDFRETILDRSPDGKIMVTNFDGCVVGYPMAEWERIEESFGQINFLNRKLRDFHRFFISGAVEVVLDKQGRILVPPHLREYAKLNREIALAGVGKKFEIWDRGHFEAQRAKMEENFDNVMDSLAENGFELRI
ncbi:MAG: division/cell wall cluster transcriptional repressor MraZ [Desulfovibrionales bacterium]